MTPLVATLVLLCISKTSSVNPYSTQKEFLRTNKEFQTSNQNLFSPRMDYDEWTPLGRGDPLKNDPTYDYVPPVLEKVQYWMDPSKRTPDPPQRNSGLLVLGSRTESTFTSRPTTPRYQVFQSKETQADSRIDTSSLLDPFFKLMDVSQFSLNFNTNNQYKPVPNRIQRPHHANVKPRTPQPPQALQRPPYTVLMPPPPPPVMPSQPVTNLITSHATTVPEKIQTQETTMTTPPISTTTTTTTTTTTVPNTTVINTTILANTENMFKPVAISMPGSVEPSKDATTEAAMVLPIVTMFDNYKKPTNEVKKQQQSNPNHLQRQTTPKHKPPKSSHHQNKPESIRDQAHTRVGSPYENTLRATTAPSMTTTAKYHSMTTDPMFKHYKQPLEPVRGPFYLIIQGHSKVKTYGASKNPVHKLLTSNEIKYDEEEIKKRGIDKYDRRSRRLSYDTINDEGNNIDETKNREEIRNFSLRDNLESLEETFPKSQGGSSKKRYLGSNHRRKRSTETKSKKETSSEVNTTEKPDNLDLESLIAISDDYDPENVADILLKEEGSEGSGLGNFALSIFSRSADDGQEV